MEEIKVGEYVRSLINGQINKVSEIRDLLEEPNVKYYKFDAFRGFCSTEIDSVKHSFNIIDLIEVGDYVNGVEVIDKYKFGEQQRLVMIQTMEYGYENEMLEEHIKSIVTKEQFKNVMYEV